MSRTSSARIAAGVLTVAALILSSTGPAVAAADINPDTGHDMFLGNGQSQFRYGPDIILDQTGMHVLTCSNGSGGAWDYIRMQSTTDGGATWAPEVTVLTPTSNGRDAFSTCDPGVAKFGGYYYLAYTSTEVPTGSGCDIYVARSSSLEGPYQKWNGTGWGGAPQPIIEFTGPEYDYGAGEPSLVVMGGTLYLYYTWASHDPALGVPINQTRLVTASTADPLWPASLTYQGIAFDKRVEIDADSVDVKYVDAWNKFIAINSAKRFGPNSFIQAWESTDGLTWSPANLDSQSLKPFLHNVGISGDDQGHLNPTQQNYVGYAYGSAWEQANWSTSIDPIELSNTSGPAKPRIYTATPGNGSVIVDFQLDTKASSYTIRYGTSPAAMTGTVTGITATPFTLTGLTNGTKYYVALEGMSGGSSSGVGEPVSATPQNYQPVTSSGATASSTYSAELAPSRVIDGNDYTFYSSAFHSNPYATEWLTLDVGSVTNIGRVVVTNRQPSYLAGFGIDSYFRHTIQTSVDGSTWASHDLRLETTAIRGNDGIVRTYVDFPNAVEARFIRLNATRLNTDPLGGYYLQIAELKAYSLPGGGFSSSAYSGLPPSHLTDGSSSSFFSSVLYPDSNHTEWAGVDLGSPRNISGVRVVPRSDGQGFPKDFVIETSANGTTWTAVSGQTYSNYTNPGSVELGLRFGQLINARFLRIRATKLGTDSLGHYALQFAGIVPDVRHLPATATASSTILPSLAATNLTDGLPWTFWSSNGHPSAAATEWLQLDLGVTRNVSEVQLTPREDYAFPKAFQLQYSQNGTTWLPLPGKAFASYPAPSTAGTSPDPVQVLAMQRPVSLRYLRITATTLRPDDYGSYYLQLTEVSVR